MPRSSSRSWTDRVTLPAPLATALDLVWSAARPELLRILALQAASAIGLATQLVLARGLLQLFVGETTHGPLATGDLGLLAAFAAATALAGFAAAALPEQVVLVAELVSRRATDQVIDVACAVEAAEFASPSFQDQLERVRSHGVLQPWRLTSGLLTSMHSLLGLLGIGVAIASVAVWLLPLALLAWVPIWMVARHSTKVGWRQVMQGATDERVRAQFVHVFLSQESAHEVRAFDLRRSLRPRFAELLDRRIERLRHVARHRVRAALATSGIGALAVAGGVGLLAWLVATDHLEVAQAGVAAVAVQQLGSRLRSGRGALAALRECRPYLDDLAALMARAPAAAAGVQDAVGPTLDDVVAAPRSPTPGRRRAGSEPPRVTLDRVDFTYPGASAPALHDLSLTIEPGETLALVGHNGSGKSTLTRLLAGLYAPTGGRILWDGVDVSRLEPGQIRDQVAVLFQDFVRYPFSAQINVGVGRPEHLDDADAIRVAASLAGIRERVEALPRGWDTPLMRSLEGGADLSIGEWQRLSLARAFLRDAPLVLLDEPTAAVDPETEAALLEAIFTHGRGRSLVLISHRLSSVRRADRIVVLAHGRIVECGGHEELLARGGLYATLFETQAAGYRDTPEVRRAAGA